MPKVASCLVTHLLPVAVPLLVVAVPLLVVAHPCSRLPIYLAPCNGETWGNSLFVHLLMLFNMVFPKQWHLVSMSSSRSFGEVSVYSKTHQTHPDFLTVIPCLGQATVQYPP